MTNELPKIMADIAAEIEAKKAYRRALKTAVSSTGACMAALDTKRRARLGCGALKRMTTLAASEVGQARRGWSSIRTNCRS
jgi:hypothetical protein